jgi:hypothetical protein
VSRLASALLTGKNLPPIAATVARLFFPQSRSLGIDLGSYSPGLLNKIVYAGSNAPAFAQGSQHLLVLAEVSVPTKQVERLTELLGQERQDERDAAVAAWLARPLAQREDPPPAVTPLGPSAVAVVEMDGGRLQIRTWDGQPDKTHEAANDSAGNSQEQQVVPAAPADSVTSTATPGEQDGEGDRPPRAKHWRGHKVGCLLEMSSEVSDVDPCPEIPSVFVDPLQALKLAQEIGQCAVPKGTPFERAEAEKDEGLGAAETEGRAGRPEVERRRVVASRQDVHAFGPVLAAAAWAMGLFNATRRAFVADGLSENWTVYKRYFGRWTAILDFVHAMTYVYAAAMAARSFAQGWPVYERWIRWLWAGQVSQVIEELTLRQQEVGVPDKEDKEGSPRRVVQETLTYLNNHKDKMRYDEYRKQGLPIMSSHVESTIKQINYRVKGTEKFWSEEGAEALLQLRADYLSENEPLQAFWQRRQAAATGQRRYRRRAA